MKPYFEIKSQRHAKVIIPGAGSIYIIIEKLGREYVASFTVDGMRIVRSQARAFVKACDMALNFADVKKHGSGGRVQHEFNDGLDFFYFRNSMQDVVAFDGREFILPAKDCNHNGAELRRYRKVVGTAVKFKRPKKHKWSLW